MKKFDKKNLDCIYGPVLSRRFGPSLGINLSGNNKNCSYNCLYCFRGFNCENSPEKLPGKADMLDAMLVFLGNYTGDRFVNWTIAGNGEPTDNPEFPEIIEAMIAMRNHLSPDAKLILLTNGMGLLPSRNPRYQEFLSAINLVDRVHLKLDSGRPATWQQLNQPEAGTTFKDWFSAIQKLKAPEVQTILVGGQVDNTTEAEVEALLDCYRKLDASRIRIETFHHVPADSTLKMVNPRRIKEIRKLVTEALQFVSAR